MSCNVCNKYRKSKKTKISYGFKKTLSLSIVYSKCGHEYETLFKEEEPIEKWKILDVYDKIYNHVWRKHKMKNIHKTRNYILAEIK